MWAPFGTHSCRELLLWVAVGQASFNPASVQYQNLWGLPDPHTSKVLGIWYLEVLVPSEGPGQRLMWY